VNFPLILVIATAVTGVIWLIDLIFFKRLLFEPFKIPSGSMIPTLLVGDFILVSKFSYGVRLPVIHTKILETGEPERGDVAVFRYPRDPSLDYIKRVVGLPGDKIVYRDKTFYINGEQVKISGGEPYIPAGAADANVGSVRLQESLGDGTHDILVRNAGFSGGESVYEVPEGHYFMVGDNRDNSNDSRVWGVVPEENLVGRATYIWMHWSDGVLWNRLGGKIE